MQRAGIMSRKGNQRMAQDLSQLSGDPQNASPRTNLFLWIAAAAALAAVAAWIAGSVVFAGAGVVLALCSLAIFFQAHATLKIFAFTFWVFAFFIGALFFPAGFLTWGSFEQKRLIVPLIQLIMFGMGATLSLGDFGRALKMPKAVAVGILLQFSVMPVLGWAIATSIGFDPEVTTGIILIGACSGGVASNVMAYLAKGNVALSVTMTACSTMMAPIMTPLAMKLLAGELMEIDSYAMMISILKLIVLPIAAGLLANHLMHGRRAWLDKVLPVVSMSGICYIIAIIAANNRDKILTVGAGLFAAAILHNCIGYLLGYWGARASGINETDSRTVAFEVGMQNGGMGTALAMDVLKSSSAALGPAIFGTWMNISGSTLASWWRERPPKPAAA